MSQVEVSFPKSLHKEFRVAGAKRCVLLVHGLNNNPELLSDWAEEFNAGGMSALIVSLTGHRGDISAWSDVTLSDYMHDVRSVYDYALKNYQHIDLFAFSMGSVISLALETDSAKRVVFSKKIVLASPIYCRPYVEALRGLVKVAPQTSFLSLSPKPFRASKKTSFAAYNALFKAIDICREREPRVDLFVFDPGDRLVDGRKLHQNRPQDRFLYVKNSHSSRHMLIVKSTFHSDEWTRMRKVVWDVLCD